MKATIKKAGILFVTILIISSCKNHSFLPQVQNTPVFTEENNIEVNAAVSTKTLDAQLAYSPIKHFGIMANMAMSYDGMVSPEIGLGAYNAFENRLYLGLYGGYAYCEYNYNRQKEFHTILSIDNFYYNYDIKIKANRIFLQPQISMLFTDKMNLTFSVKLSNWFVSDYYYRVDRYDHYSGPVDPQDPTSVWKKSGTDTVNVKNSNSYTVEPSLTFKAGGENVKFMLQTGVYTQTYYGNDVPSIYRKVFPLVIRVGINAKIKTNKK